MIDVFYNARTNTGGLGTTPGKHMGVTLYTFEVPLGTPMKKVGTSGTPMLEALLKVYTNV